MNNIYDNGTCLLGTKKDIYNYILNDERLENWEYEDILEEIKDFNDTDILCINFDCGMGLSIEYWENTDIVKEEK
jgi:hypothetical protein